MKTFKTPMTGPGGLAPGMENRDWQPSSHRRNTPVPGRQQQVFQISILFLRVTVSAIRKKLL